MAKPKSSRRPRDYKAEYKRRLARGKKQGKTRQAARGHRPKEHVERNRRAKAKYGVSASTLTRLRAKARDRLLAIYHQNARNPVDENTVRRGMRMLHAEDLIELVALDDLDLKLLVQNGSKIQGASPAHDSYIHQLAEYFPASIDDLEAVDYNPLWYHR